VLLGKTKVSQARNGKFSQQASMVNIREGEEAVGLIHGTMAQELGTLIMK